MPARREDHISVTASDQFPLKFSPHRLIENVQVAERAIKIWPHVKAYVQKVTEKSIPNPRTTSYDTVASCTKDTLIIIKLLAFVSIAKLVTPFLVKYQTDTISPCYLLLPMTKNAVRSVCYIYIYYICNFHY